MKRLGALTSAAGARQGAQVGRYLTVVVGGFIVDLTLAWLTHKLFGLDLLLAAAFGFVVAMVLSYFAHEFWAFRRPDSAASLPRFMKFVAACGATLATRLLLVWASGLVSLLSEASLIRLLIAYGGSLVVGFVLNRNTVFIDTDESAAATRSE